MARLKRDDTAAVYYMLLAALAVLLAVTWLLAAQESRTFNRLTGAHTTAWDALWVELRVQDGVQRDG